MVESTGTTSPLAQIFIPPHLPFAIVSPGVGIATSDPILLTNRLVEKVPVMNKPAVKRLFSVCRLPMCSIGWSGSKNAQRIGGVALATKGKTKTSKRGKKAIGVDQKLVKALAHAL